MKCLNHTTVLYKYQKLVVLASTYPAKTLYYMNTVQQNVQLYLYHYKGDIH